MSIRQLAMVLCVAGAVLRPSVSEASSIVIGTNGNIQPFGEANTATYGQTFKTVNGTDLFLDSFSFWLNDALNADAVDFAGYVMQWDTALALATGPVLYSSTGRTTTNNGGANGDERFDFLTGGLLLNASNTYVAFLSASNFFDGTNGTATMPWQSPGSYADGSFVFNNNGNNFGLLTSTTWSVPTGADARFEAQFSATATAVPEPATMLLVAVGLAGFTTRRWRQRA